MTGFDATASVTVCAFTTDPTEAPLFRIEIQPNADNGLRSPSRLMADKITTVPLTKLGSRVGYLDENDMARLSRSVILFLNLLETVLTFAAPAARVGSFDSISDPL